MPDQFLWSLCSMFICLIPEKASLSNWQLLCVLITQLCPTLCDPMDCSPSSSSVHGISQAIILEWVAISFSRQLLYLYWLQSSSSASLRTLRNFLEPCNELFSPTTLKDTLQGFRNMVRNKAFPVTVYCAWKIKVLNVMGKVSNSIRLKFKIGYKTEDRYINR